VNDAIDCLVQLSAVDGRLAAAGYPAGQVIKSGSPELRAASLANDILRRNLARLDDLRRQLDASAAAIAELKKADIANKLGALLSRPAGSA
jgi:hypothetical protein